MRVSHNDSKTRDARSWIGFLGSLKPLGHRPILPCLRTAKNPELKRVSDAIKNTNRPVEPITGVLFLLAVLNYGVSKENTKIYGCVSNETLSRLY